MRNRKFSKFCGGKFNTIENELQRKLHNLTLQENQEQKIQKQKIGQGADQLYRIFKLFFCSRIQSKSLFDMKTKFYSCFESLYFTLDNNFSCTPSFLNTQVSYPYSITFVFIHE